MEPEMRHPIEDRPWVGRAVLHVDLDAFFASVEQLDHPEWRGLPVIVGGDPGKRGVVSTASYEARAYGIHSAMPSARARQLCPSAIWAPARFERYREFSGAVFEILRTESPLVQPVSVDEAFLDATPGAHDFTHPVEIARHIRVRIADLGLTASVGVATSKTVAKIASDHDKPDALTVVEPGTEAAFLAPMLVSVMSGIGPRTSQRLASLGIRTLGQLARVDDETARAVLGSGGSELVRRAAGVDDRPIHERDAAKQISAERTFSTDVRTAEELGVALDALAARVGRRLRRKGVSGRTVTVKTRFSDFTTRTVRRTLELPTDDERVIGPVARELAANVWTPGVGLRLLGVAVSGFLRPASQLSFDVEDAAEDRNDARRELIRGIDAVRERFGENALRLGREIAPSSEADEGVSFD